MPAMLNLFRKKEKKKAPPELFDLNNNPLAEGDTVISKRYDLGECKIELEDLQYFYVSQSSGKKVSYVKMIDAISGNQKVLKKGMDAAT